MNPYRIEGPALLKVSFGRTSMMMLRLILDAHGGRLPYDVIPVFCNTGKEMEQSLAFGQRCSIEWNVHIVWLEYDPTEEHKVRIVSHNSASRNGEPLEAAIRNRGFLPNPITRFCTVETKIRTATRFARDMLGWDHWTNVVGLRADEMHRVNKLAKERERSVSIAPLAQAGVTKRDVSAFWQGQPFDLALPNINGTTPLGNCDLCFLKKESTIRSILRDRPDLGDWWIRMEREAKPAKPDGARFRIDRPTYAEMLDTVRRQGDLLDPFSIVDDGGSVDCACTD